MVLLRSTDNMSTRLDYENVFAGESQLDQFESLSFPLTVRAVLPSEVIIPNDSRRYVSRELTLQKCLQTEKLQCARTNKENVYIPLTYHYSVLYTPVFHEQVFHTVSDLSTGRKKYDISWVVATKSFTYKESVFENGSVFKIEKPSFRQSFRMKRNKLNLLLYPSMKCISIPYDLIGKFMKCGCPCNPVKRSISDIISTEEFPFLLKLNKHGNDEVIKGEVSDDLIYAYDTKTMDTLISCYVNEKNKCEIFIFPSKLPQKLELLDDQVHIDVLDDIELHSVKGRYIDNYIQIGEQFQVHCRYEKLGIRRKKRNLNQEKRRISEIVTESGESADNNNGSGVTRPLGTLNLKPEKQSDIKSESPRPKRRHQHNWKNRFSKSLNVDILRHKFSGRVVKNKPLPSIPLSEKGPLPAIPTSKSSTLLSFKRFNSLKGMHNVKKTHNKKRNRNYVIPISSKSKNSESDTDDECDAIFEKELSETMNLSEMKTNDKVTVPEVCTTYENHERLFVHDITIKSFPFVIPSMENVNNFTNDERPKRMADYLQPEELNVQRSEGTMKISKNDLETKIKSQDTETKPVEIKPKPEIKKTKPKLPPKPESLRIVSHSRKKNLQRNETVCALSTRSTDFVNKETEEVNHLSIGGVQKLLSDVKLSHLQDVFRSNQIDGVLLAALDESSLKDLNATKFEARMLAAYVHGWRPLTDDQKTMDETLDLSKPVEQYSVEELPSFIEKCGFPDLGIFLLKHNVDGKLFVDMISDELLCSLESEHQVVIKRYQLIKLRKIALEGYKPKH